MQNGLSCLSQKFCSEVEQTVISDHPEICEKSELGSPHFLIVKMSSLGDVIQCFCIADYLHKRFPGSKIDWVVEKPYASLLEAHPLINRVIVGETKKWRKALFNFATWGEIGAFRSQVRESFYDAVFDLQGNSKSGFPTFFARAKDKVGYKWGVLPEWPNLLATNKRFNVDTSLQINNQYLSLVKKYFRDVASYQFSGIDLTVNQEKEEKINNLFASKQLNHSQRFMICPGSNWRNKRLREETLRDFLIKLSDKLDVSFLFVWGNNEEKSHAISLQRSFFDRSLVIGDLEFSSWQRIMSGVDCVISMDSSSLHLCATTKTPSFSVFGPSCADVYRPYGEKHFAFQGHCPYGKIFKKRCSVLRTCETGACMRDLSPKILSKSFFTWWNSLS